MKRQKSHFGDDKKIIDDLRLMVVYPSPNISIEERKFLTGSFGSPKNTNIMKWEQIRV